MATIDYQAIKLNELRKMARRLNEYELTKRPIATRGKPTVKSLSEEFVRAIEECSEYGTLDAIPEDVYQYYCSIMVPEDDDEEEPDVNEGYERDEDDDLVDEYRKSQKKNQEPEEDYDSDEGSILDTASDEDEDEDDEPDEDEEDEPDEDEDDEDDEDEPDEDEDDEEEDEDEPAPPKRGRGRPRKTASEKSEGAPKRGPGRPKKSESREPSKPAKRGPGRPKKSETVAERVEAAPRKVLSNRPTGSPKRTTPLAPPSRMKKGGKSGPPKRAEIFFEVIQGNDLMTKIEIVDAMLERGYSSEDNRIDALFWVNSYLTLLIVIGIVEKRGEGKTAKYKYLG